MTDYTDPLDLPVRRLCSKCEDNVANECDEYCTPCRDSLKRECPMCEELYDELARCHEAGCEREICRDCGPYCYIHGEPLRDGLEPGSWAGGFAANH